MLIEYTPGKYNSVADALSRRQDYYPNCPRCQGKIRMNATKKVPNPQLIAGTKRVQICTTRITVNVPFVDQIKRAYTPIERADIDKRVAEEPNPQSPSWRWIEGVAFMGTRLYVPLSMRQKVMYHTQDLKSIHSGT